MRQEAKQRVGNARSSQNYLNRSARSVEEEARVVMIAEATLLPQETLKDANDERASAKPCS